MARPGKTTCWTTASRSRRFKALCAAVELRYRWSIHNLRHTLATARREVGVPGVPDKQAATLLGHDVSTYRGFHLVADGYGAASAALLASPFSRRFVSNALRSEDPEDVSRCQNHFRLPG